MNILIDICHPGQVHLLKNFYNEMCSKGHFIIVTIKNIPDAMKLLDLLNIKYIDLGFKSDTLLGKGINQLRYNLAIYKLIKKYKIEVGIGSSVSIAQVSKISKMKSVILDDDDDEVEPLFVKFAHTFADIILSPDAVKEHRKSSKAIFYNSYHELAYLHPENFTPDKSVLDLADLNENEKFFILRFNAFKAHHDSNVKGLSNEDKNRIIELLSNHGKVFITSEYKLQPEFEKYQLKIPSNLIHSLLYYSHMFVGDSQTMTSEAAVLGVPSIRLNSLADKISYLNEQEKKYGLTFGFKSDSQHLMFEKIEELLAKPDLKVEWQKRRYNMLNEKINLTNFFVNFIHNKRYNEF